MTTQLPLSPDVDSPSTHPVVGEGPVPSRGSTSTTFEELIKAGALAMSDGYRAKNEELGGDGLPFLRAGYVSDQRIDLSDPERFRSDLTFRLLSKTTAPGDVVITTKGNSTGRVAFITDDLPQSVYSPHLTYWRSLRHDVLVPGFLRAWSRGSEFLKQLHAMSRGTDMAPYLSLIDQRRLRITLPPLPEQRAIAAVLGALDDKIEVNRQMSRTLEEIARTLFDSWFVRFDPVHAKAAGRHPEGMDPATAALFPDHFEASDHGLVPAGWTPTPVRDLAEINSWTLGSRDPLDRIEYIEISEVESGRVKTVQHFQRGEEPGRARRRLRHGDTVLSTVRPDRGAHFLCLDPSKNLVASTGFAVLTPRSQTWSFVYAAMTDPRVGEHLGKVADGGAYPAVSSEIIGDWIVAAPSDSQIVRRFHEHSASHYELVNSLERETRNISQTRDALLPMLLSGQLAATGFSVEQGT